MNYFLIPFLMAFALIAHAQDDNIESTLFMDSLEATQLSYFDNNQMLLDLLEEYDYNFDGSRNRSNTSNDGYTDALWRVPIKIWITRRSDGSDGFAIDEAFDIIEQVNEQYDAAGTGIQFYALCDVDFIDNDNFHEFPDNATTLVSFINAHSTPEVIDLYFVREIDGFWGVARRPDQTPNLAALVTRTADISIFTHELGHVLALLHTHHPGRVAGGTNGQVGNCYQESVDRQKGNGFPCNYVGHLKCEINGDFLCDTEADPFLEDNAVTNCVYTGGDEDNWGETWTPDPTNFMSNGPFACLSTFTPMQIGVMIDAIQSRLPGSYQLPSNDFDVYEPDNLALNSNEIFMSMPQYHTFHWTPDGNGGFEACDVDWLNYSTVGTSGNFTIRTYGQGFWPTPNTILTGFGGKTDDDAHPFTGLSFLRLLNVPTGQDGFTIEVENKSVYPHQDSRGHYGIVIEDCDDCCPNGHFYNIPTLNSNTGSYNFAALTSQYTEAISEDLDVVGVDLSFNKSIPRFYLISNNVLPANNSTLKTKICNEAVVQIDNNSTLEIGDDNTNRTAHLIVKNRSTLILKSGSTLKINNNSKLIIESEGILYIEPNVTIELNGSNAILEIDGYLGLANNAVFSPSGSGHLVMGMPSSGPKISCGANSEILLKGANPTDLILEIKDNASLRPEPGLSNLVIEDGMVLMGENSFISTANAGFKLEDLDIKGSTSNTTHKGIFVNGQSNHILNRIDLQDGLHGITAYQYWNQGALLQASNLDISNCDIGLLVYGKGTFLNTCNFHHNRIGYQQELATFNSNAITSDFSNNDEYGVYFNNTSGDLRAQSCKFDLNGIDGIRFSGNASFAPSCGSAKNNGTTGIYLGMNSRLFMDDSYESQGANMNVVGNPISIRAALAKDIYLDEGRNDIMSLPYNGGHRDINGTLLISNSSPYFKQAAENHWNNRSVPCLGKPPAYGTDYQLTGVTSVPVYFTDNFRLCPPAMCASGPGDDGGDSGMNKAALNEITIISTKNFPGIALDQALNIAIGEMEIMDEHKDDLKALSLFYEILDYNYKALKTEELIYLDLAYARMLTTFHHACASGKISTNPTFGVSESNHHLQMLVACSKKMQLLVDEIVETNQFLIDQALIYHTLGRHQHALKLLANINTDKSQSNQSTRQKEMIDYYTCMISAQNDALSGDIDFTEFEERFLQCQTEKVEKVVLSANENASSFESSEINVYPNPTQDVLNIEIPIRSYEKVNLELFDVQGRLMINDNPTIIEMDQTSDYQLNIRDLREGVYFLRLKIDEKYFFHKVIKQ
ncbi:MAG: T9SS type A sorting domain-containing protein [Bacteroidota bacterium]